MLTHRGFSAWIESNGVRLPEYLVAVDENVSRVSCWIPGVEGQTFTVHWKDEGSKVSTCGFITLDGLVVPGRFLFGDGATSRGGVRSSKSSERPFLFKKVDDSGPESSKQGAAKDAGMVALKIKRIKCVTGRPANPIQPVPSTGVLGKRKAGDLCVGFGEETDTQPQSEITWQVASYEDETPGAKPRTYVSFVFRYRSPEFLEAQGIASPEDTKLVIKPPQRVTRRLASLPAPPPPPEPEFEQPFDRPAKKPRLMSVQPNFPVYRGPRRPSAELRRTVSWNPSRPVESDDSFSSVEGPTESSFFLPRSYCLQPSTGIGPPDSSGTSASPESSVIGEGSFNL